MANRFAVIGLGYFGEHIARELSAMGAEVIAVDQKMENVEDIKDDVTHAIRMDATDEKALKTIGLQDLEAAIVSIGENFTGNVLTCALLVQLGCRKVIARATDSTHARILKLVGVHQIISPEEVVAERLARSLVQEKILDWIPLTEDYQIVQIKTPETFVGKSLQNIQLRRKFHVNLITIKRHKASKHHDGDGEDYIIGVPTAETIIEKDDILVLLGSEDRVESLLKE